MNFLRFIRVARMPGDPTRGLIDCGTRRLRCALGRSGPSVFKREGDGASPACHVMRAMSGFYRQDRTYRPRSSLAFHPIADDDGWCDAPTDANYNLPVKLPFGPSHEKMARDDGLYDIGVILDWNMPQRGRRRHRGSAIFLHLAKGNYRPTEGCIAVNEADMRWLLRYIDNHTKIFISR